MNERIRQDSPAFMYSLSTSFNSRLQALHNRNNVQQYTITFQRRASGKNSQIKNERKWIDIKCSMLLTIIIRRGTLSDDKYILQLGKLGCCKRFHATCLLH